MNILEQFGLNDEQALILFSLQRSLVTEDIKAEKICLYRKRRNKALRYISK
ncbi:hypothetical protein [Bacillus sp. FJAT-44742]|uniref:hypothetical protein n=1 Tax=Bacillus sp. FJAT-44742 TaxID=2014005 RepID=UPI0012FF2C27|nr:hypothetical protein [Bacillus sp. FJAT-44742]